ncbi:hypothetical protein IKF40_01505 [Candidatus Saccharibacteria bacterium]|nr:hypothetical protein [Candidatus Saccharibacteria bacterium]
MNSTDQNDLQQAIKDAANNNSNSNNDIELGVPPMPPVDAPFAGAYEAPTEMPPVASAENAPAPGVDVIPPAKPAEEVKEEAVASDGQSAEAILAETIVTPENLPRDDISATREGILRDLMPLMDKVEGAPERKFDIYKEAMETLHDKNLVSGAYKEAAKIADENKKADALMTLLNAIDTLE